METFNTNATVTNLKGETVNADATLCEILPIVLLGLESIKALSKKFFVKLAISIVISAINTFSENMCQKK